MDEERAVAPKVNLPLLAAEFAGLFMVFAAALFLAAGTLAWLAGWLFLLLFFGLSIVLSLWLLRYNPALLRERMTGIGKADQKAWDKALFALLQLLFLTWLVVMPLDAVRFHWSRMPGWLQVTGAAGLVGSFYLFYLVFRENAYLSPAVRVQRERGQTVVSTGPYHHVRHPMYATAIIFIASAALLLGSWYGLLIGFIIVLLIARRAVLEEQTLREELPDYAAYMQQVRYRLVPHVW
ncbi:MAG TPA: isoprenylcysteine carboxylmethyltransferase family protein [Chloroflexota bacterium]|nr:isoprenylcysteine carboxylmethyltransferase family protein [Chloroflexota bacterium]